MKVKNADVLSTLVVIVYIHVGVIITQEDPQSALFVNCSFQDGMCDWESIYAGWKIGQVSITTSGTGSAHGHALRNASRISVNASQSQVLQSPLLSWNESCLNLWYHICGKDTGKLTVSIETKDTTTATKFSTTQSGIMTILWSQEGKTLQTQESARVLLVRTTKRQNGAIAVDDIQLPKCCKGDCCRRFWYWIQRASDYCTRTFGILFPKTTGPQSGCTNKTTGPQSDGTNKNTKKQNGSTKKQSSTKTTGQKSEPKNQKNTAQSGHTEKTTGPQSGLTTSTGTRATSTTSDLTESTFSAGWEDAYTNTTSPDQSDVTEASTNGSGRLITTKGHIPDTIVGVITVSLVGTVMFVVLTLLVGVWICRKRRRHRKKVEPFELQPISSKPSSIDDERGYSSSAAHCINPGYTISSNASRSGNKALINDKTDDANYEYSSAFQSTTSAQWTDDTYDTTGDKTKPHFDGAYDHIQTHFNEEYDATHLTIRTRLDACETYDHVTICSDDVYDETCMAQASTIQYKSYDHVTKSTCETPVSQQNIINSQDNIYELVA